MKDEREKELTIGAIILFNNVQAFVTGVEDLILAIQNDMVIVLLHQLCKAILLRSCVGDLHPDALCAMVLKERVNDKCIPDMFSCEGGANCQPPNARLASCCCESAMLYVQAQFVAENLEYHEQQSR